MQPARPSSRGTSTIPIASYRRTPSPTASTISLRSSASRSTPPPPLNKTTPIGKDNVVVTVRVRPLNENEIGQRLTNVWQVNEEEGKITMDSDVAEKARKQAGTLGVTDFNYDVVQYGSDNKELYDLCAQNVVWAAMEGINGTVFAYGQTASGKTYTMMGQEDQPGIIPQAIDDVFAYIREQTEDREYLLRVSYLEIYNETIRDLLNPQQQDLRIHEDRKRGVYVSPLREEIVTTPKQVMKVIQRGEQARSYGSTEYNERSSRSHTVFQMIIESRDKNSGVTSPNAPGRSPVPGASPPVPGRVRGSVTLSQLNLIDLAGSEKAASDLDRRKEGAFINKSLLTLGTVISRLTEDTVKPVSAIHIPFRDSKLTRLLQSSLSGNARVSVIATVSPPLPNLEETTNTLKFASRIKKVVLHAKQNQVLSEKALIQKYKLEIAELRHKLMETNDLLEQERALQDIGLERSIRMQYEERLHEGQLVRTALKERIDHLTRLILSSTSVTPKAILDWNAPLLEAAMAGVGVQNNRTSVILDGLLPQVNAKPNDTTSGGNFSTPSGATTPTSNTVNNRKSHRLSRQQSGTDFLHRQIAELDKRDTLISQYSSLLTTLKTAPPSEIPHILSLFENDMDLTVQTVDDLKDEIYRLKRRNEELEIVVREQDEKLEVVEAAGVLERGGVVAFEESTRYKEMSLLIMQLRSGVEERDGVVKGLKGQVQELRGRVRELELREFERLEAMSGGLQPEVEGKLVGRLREAERELDTLKVERERERDENERRVEGLEADVRGLRVELFSRMSISSVDDQVEN